MATKWGKQAIRETDTRKIGFLEVPNSNTGITGDNTTHEATFEAKR